MLLVCFGKNYGHDDWPREGSLSNLQLERLDISVTLFSNLRQIKCSENKPIINNHNWKKVTTVIIKAFFQGYCWILFIFCMQLNFQGVTLNRNEPYLHFVSNHHVFTPVAIRDSTPPRQACHFFKSKRQNVFQHY